MYRSVHTVFRKSYVSCEDISSRVSSAHMGCNMGQGDHTADTDLRAQIPWAQYVMNLPRHQKCLELWRDVCCSVWYVKVTNA